MQQESRSKMKNNKKHKQHTIVYSTKDYAWFKKTRGNRDATVNHCRKIRNSIVEKDLEMVIYVNNNGTIREGHTTFEVRKDLGLPIYYIMNDKFVSEDVSRFNKTRENWTFSDTLNFYVTRNTRSYKVVKQKMAKYFMPIQETVGLLKAETSPSKDTSEDFKDGKYNLKYSEIKKFDDLVGDMRKIWDVRYAGKKMPRSFIRMAAKAAKNPNWSVERGKVAMKNHGAKLDGCKSEQEMVDNFGIIFDKGLDKSKRLNLKRFVEDKLYEKQEKRILN